MEALGLLRDCEIVNLVVKGCTNQVEKWGRPELGVRVRPVLGVRVRPELGVRTRVPVAGRCSEAAVARRLRRLRWMVLRQWHHPLPKLRKPLVEQRRGSAADFLQY